MTAFDPGRHRQKALRKKAENRKFFNRLKKRPPKNIDLIVSGIHDEVFAYTDCLSCANCCKTTGPMFTARDIARISKYLKVKEAAFIDKYLRRDEDGDLVFRELPCPFLDADNYCTIYEQRPKACAEYPHTNRRRFLQLDTLTIKNTEICPAAYDIVEKLKRLM